MTTLDARKTLMVLLKLTEHLTEDRPLEAFLDEVTETAVTLVGAEHASIRLLDTEGSRLISGARSGADKDAVPPEFRKGEGIAGWVVENKTAARIDDATADSRFVTFDTQSFKVRSIICEPVWASGEVIGVLSVSAPTVGYFDSEAQLLVRLLANCSAPAIERARLKRLAMFDQNTMAFAHHYLFPRIAEEMERARRSRNLLSVLLMDLDHFKSVNDVHGHAVGDMALRLFADHVRAQVRRMDVLIRRGGEEFVLIMPATDDAQATATATRIRESLEATPLRVGPNLALMQTVSIGVATWDGQETAQELEHRADLAMYEAKRKGRNRVMRSSAPPASVPALRS